MSSVLSEGAPLVSESSQSGFKNLYVRSSRGDSQLASSCTCTLHIAVTHALLTLMREPLASERAFDLSPW
eukprot:scaffold6448_cov124-Isochrysis_galbana.AAC.1